MPKYSRQTRKNTRGSSLNCSNPPTSSGLHEWYRHMFEKLGWMVLAKSYGDMNYKIDAYKESVLRLRTKIQCKIEHMRDYDRRSDLYIMLRNVNILIDHVEKDF
jgi:hypothetical protein